MQFLQSRLCKAGIVAVDLVDRQRRVVAGITEEDRPERVAVAADDEDGHAVVDRCGRRGCRLWLDALRAAVGGEAALALAKGQRCRPQVARGRLDHLHEVVFQGLGVGCNRGLLLCVEIIDQGGDPRDDRPAMRV